MGIIAIYLLFTGTICKLNSHAFLQSLILVSRPKKLVHGQHCSHDEIINLRSNLQIRLLVRVSIISFLMNLFLTQQLYSLKEQQDFKTGKVKVGLNIYRITDVAKMEEGLTLLTIF